MGVFLLSRDWRANFADIQNEGRCGPRYSRRRDRSAILNAVPAINARWAAIRPPESARLRPRKGRSSRDFGGSARIRGFWPPVKKMMGLTLVSQAIVRVY